MPKQNIVKKKKHLKCPDGFFKGEKQKNLRDKYGLTLDNLATDISTTNSTIWRMENVKDYSPNLWTIGKVVDVFNKYGENVSISDFIDPSKIVY